jgi:hypothetical protein
MRRWLITLFLGVCLCRAQDVPVGVQKALRDRDPSLDRFRVIATEPVNADTSAILAYASPTQPGRGPQGKLPLPDRNQAGVFLVSRKTSQVQKVVDVFPLSEVDGFPSLDRPDAHSIRLHFYSDYGIYNGSREYFYDLAPGKTPVLIRYGMLGMNSSRKVNGALVYSASYAKWNQGKLEPGFAKITIEPAAVGSERPGYKIAVAAEATTPEKSPGLFRAAGQTLLVENETPPGQQHVPSGIRVETSPGHGEFYPVPVPNQTLNRKMVPEKPVPFELENDIGPFAFDGQRIWFANTFYDGEGVSGVGAIGSFDPATRRFEMRYLPEIAPWSGSAILLDGDDVWVGLMRRPEGAAIGGGLLRYNKANGAVVKYVVAGLIHTIDRMGDTIYCGTSNGLYTVRGDEIRQFRFEPDESGKLVMVAARGKPESPK